VSLSELAAGDKPPIGSRDSPRLPVGSVALPRVVVARHRQRDAHRAVGYRLVTKSKIDGQVGPATVGLVGADLPNHDRGSAGTRAPLAPEAAWLEGIVYRNPRSVSAEDTRERIASSFIGNDRKKSRRVSRGCARHRKPQVRETNLVALCGKVGE